MVSIFKQAIPKLFKIFTTVNRKPIIERFTAIQILSVLGRDSYIYENEGTGYNWKY